ncbi:MAG: hypothetical protein K5634_00905 [Sphaerochaetaceae bacterium]|nr:hypothetical protein [Sphaerochaetaceae bacterium]
MATIFYLALGAEIFMWVIEKFFIFLLIIAGAAVVILALIWLWFWIKDRFFF